MELNTSERTAMMVSIRAEETLFAQLQQVQAERREIFRDVEKRLGLEDGAISTTHIIDVDAWTVVPVPEPEPKPEPKKPRAPKQ